MVLAKAVGLAMRWAMVVDMVERLARVWFNEKLPMRGYGKGDKNMMK